MIRHIVFFRMKEGKEAEAGRLAHALSALKVGTGGLMRECEVAHDVVHAKNSYDVALNSVFAGRDDLEKYRVHPEHVKVLDLIHEVCHDTVKVDYDLGSSIGSTKQKNRDHYS